MEMRRRASDLRVAPLAANGNSTSGILAEDAQQFITERSIDDSQSCTLLIKFFEAPGQTLFQIGHSPKDNLLRWGIVAKKTLNE